MKLLVVEDEPKIARILSRSLTEAGYAVDVAGDVNEAGTKFELGTYDLVVLDLLLPGHPDGGLEVCRRIREAGTSVPILMLTAINSVESRVKGLDSGADDYLAKPFDLDELQARIRALLRRIPKADLPVLRAGDLELDPAVRTVRRGKRVIGMSSKEFQLLEYLMRHKDRAVSQTELLDHVWDTEYEGMSNVIEVTIRNVRRKTGEPELIRTVRGQGYVLVNGDA
jgi:DNA-binding response OmpR family regulator